MPDSSIPEGYRPFDESLALGRDFSSPELPYAPWSGGETFGVDYGEIDPYAGGGKAPTGYEYASPWAGAAGGAGAGMAGAAGAYGAGMASGGVPGMAGLMSAGVLGPAGLVGAGLGGLAAGLGAFKKGKKRGHTVRKDPMYQGHQFRPEEGFPAYYEQAQGVNVGQSNLGDPGFQYQQPEQHGYDYNYTGGVSQPGSGQLANPSQQNYVGQREMEYGSFYNRDKGGIFDTFTV